MARKWSNLNLPGALHYVTGNFLDRTPVFTDPECCKVFLDELQTLNRNWPSKLITYVLMPKINYIHANPVKAGLVKSAKDYYWSGFRSFHSQGDEPLAVDHDWWWPEDSEKLSKAMKEMGWYTFEKRKMKT